MLIYFVPSVYWALVLYKLFPDQTPLRGKVKGVLGAYNGMAYTGHVCHTACLHFVISGFEIKLEIS